MPWIAFAAISMALIVIGVAWGVVKRKRKGADWIIANNVSGAEGDSVMGGDLNQVHIVTASGVESLPEMPKEDVARELVLRAAEALHPVEDDHD